jgi:hypothetical protein
MLPLFSARFHPWLVRYATLLGAYRSLLAIVCFPLVILGGMYTYIQVLERLEHPDVELALEHPKSVTILIQNASREVVRDPKYQVLLLNIDDPPEQRHEPLPIPVAKGDYIRVGGHWGPNSMIGTPAVQSRVHEGNRLLGYALVDCPTCPNHFYWVYIQHGVEGWFAE